MTTRLRLAVVLSLASVLSLSVVAASKKTLSAATASVQIAIADILYDRADYRAAMQTYMAATECEDTALRDRARAGTVRSALRVAEYGVAVSHLESLAVTRTSDPATLTLAGDTLWANGRFDEAERAYRDALSAEPASPRARLGLAKSFASRNQMQPAFDEVYAALQASPGDSDIQYAIGSLLERSHRYSEAATAYLQYLSGLKGLQRNEQLQWARSHIAFLRAFDGTTPFQMVAKDNARQQVLDFRLVNGKVIVKAKVNGKKTIDFAIDTGAEHTALSEKTARRFNIPHYTETLSAGVGDVGVRGLKVGRLQSLEIGTLTVYNLPVLIKSPEMTGLPVDQTDGFSPLAIGLSVSIDYKKRKVTLGDPPPPQIGARELPLRLQRLATVQGVVNGNPSSFIVDTGGEAISVSTSTARGLFTPDDRKRIKLVVYGSSGLALNAYLLPGVNLAFGPITLPNQPVVVLDLRAPSVLLGYQIGGILGYRLLGKYRVDIDLERAMLRLGDL